MGGPFTLNLLREIMLLNALINFQPLFILSLVIITFFAAAYSLILYSSTQQGQTNNFNVRVEPLSTTEITNLALHRLPLFLLC